MNEEFCFKLLKKLPPEVIKGIHEELNQLNDWKTHKFESLGKGRLAISLRSSKNYPPSGIAVQELITCEDLPQYALCPYTKSVVDQLCSDYGWSEIGFVTFSRTIPGGEIKSHIDGGSYFNNFHRVHVCIQSDPGIWFICEDERINMVSGEVWILDNKRMHSVVNSSGVERINLFFDAR